MSSEAIKIDKSVLEEIAYIRDSGRYNMFDIGGVMEMAEEEGFYNFIEWYSNNKKAYSEGILYGFEEK